MALAAFCAVWGWRRGKTWAPGLALFALGTLFYASVNNLGLAVLRSMLHTAALAASAVVAVALARVAARRYARR